MQQLSQNLVSLFIDKSIIGKNYFIKQIAVVFPKNEKFKYLCKYIKNDYKQSFFAVSLNEALVAIYDVIKEKDVILYNDDGFDYSFLKLQYKKLLNIEFNNVVYDVSLAAKKNNIKKYNLINLSNIYNCNVKNKKNLPYSVVMAQNLYMVGYNIFFKNR